MVFNSYIFFLIILPVFLVGFYALRGRSALGCKWWILAISLLFYAPFGVKNFAVLAGSIVANALLARVVAGNGSKRADKTAAKGVLCAAVLVNLAALFFFKFSGLFFPVAISFYTFNQISYLVDLYRGER